MSDSQAIKKGIAAIEGLIRELGQSSDPAAASLSKQLIQSLMDMHGSGIERMLEIVHRRGEAGQEIIDELGRDDLVSGLLLLYDLHPVDLRTRIELALEKLRPGLQAHGGSAQLLRVTPDGAVTIRLAGTIQGCGTSPAALRSSVEQAVCDAAPEATALCIEGEILDARPAAGFVPLSTLQGGATEPVLLHKGAGPDRSG